jgi:ABC-type transport system involved in multi-copper enzyme maturation permease subunit
VTGVSNVLTIAWVTVREALRQKLAVNLLVFALALVSASIFLSALTFGEQYRIIVNIGLSTMEIFGTLIAAFLGAGLVAGDVQRRTVYPIVAKPVSRAGYVAGRYVGLVATTTLNFAAMAALFVAVLAYYLQGLRFLVETPLLVTLAATALQFAMIAAVAVLFSCFTTATLAAIFTLSLVVAGHLASDLVRYWSTRGEGAGWLGKALYVVVPNLEALNLKEAMVYKDALAFAAVAPAFAYGLLYSLGVVAVAAAIFTKRDLR